MFSEDILHIEQLVVGYPTRVCSTAISMHFGAGLVVLHGPNGCGKSTLLRTLAGILPALKGTARIGSSELRAQDVAYRRALGYAPDRMPLPVTASGGELFRLVRWARNDNKNPATGVLAQRFDVGEWCEQPVSRLSLGQRRRLCLVAALNHVPQVALLDEPTAGLDANGVKVLSDICNERSKAGLLTICVTHDITPFEGINYQAISFEQWKA